MKLLPILMFKTAEIKMQSDLTWWVSVVELPALAGLFLMFWRNKRDMERRIDENRRGVDIGISQAKEGLMAFKLEVAKHYASISYIKDLERRLTDHLLRIEEKIEERRA